MSIFKATASMFLALWVSVPARSDFVPPGAALVDDGTGFAGLSELEFNEVLDKVEASYKPVFESHGAVLIIQKLWNDDEENASASRTENSWIVTMYGGLARNSKITKDAYTLIACHELGHHLGGFVFKEKWSAAEGQSDYFAAMSCLERLWGNAAEENRSSRKSVDPKAKEMCDGVHSDSARQDLCYRVMMAGYSAASSLAGQGAVSFSTPDEYETNVTNVWHPTPQCRLDTFIQAALCTLSYEATVIPQTEEESSQYTCMTARGFDVGMRPRCWFAPAL
ncbi:MAG: hypothetical protein AB7T49_11650 [Oligoflexales bacterium]